MVHKRPAQQSDPTQRQRDLADLFLKGVQAREAQGWSRSYIAEQCGIDRKILQRYINPRQIPLNPRSETVRKICTGLGIPYAKAAAIMGWVAPASTEALTLLEDQASRARAYMRELDRRGLLTVERAAKYQAIIKSAEASYAAGMKQLFAEFEHDMQTEPAPDGPDGEPEG